MKIAGWKLRYYYVFSNNNIVVFKLYVASTTHKVQNSHRPNSHVICSRAKALNPNITNRHLNIPNSSIQIQTKKSNSYI